MKTKALLDKYKKLISGLLKVKEEDIKFLVLQKWTHNIGKAEFKEVGEILYEKKDDITYFDWCEGKYKVCYKDKEISSFELYQMPHCCAILVSCKSLVNTEFRNKRIATTLNSMRQDIGRLLGYSLLLCTDIEKNNYQRQLLATNGWKDIYNVHNKRTENKVFISVINL